jgi:histidinol-phosphate aminotransferase
MNINNIVRKNILNMKAYSSARNEFEGVDGVFLDANENPYDNGVNRYPDPYQKAVKEMLQEVKGVSVDNMMLGNGSDEVLDLLFRAFCEPKVDNVIVTSPSYGMYGVLANLNDVELKEVMLEEDFSLNPKKIIEKVDENTKMILLCSPNNPTGNQIDFEIIKEILVKVNCLVVVDEAYIDFSKEESCINYLDKYKQLVVIQTLSKFYSMAGVRLGMCFSSKEIITVLNKIKPPYNVNTLTQIKVVELLKNKNDSYKNEVITEREWLSNQLSKSILIEKVYPSDANFILVKTKNANSIYTQLVKEGVVVRNRTKEALCENCLRITVGTPQENKLVIETLKKIEL